MAGPVVGVGDMPLPDGEVAAGAEVAVELVTVTSHAIDNTVRAARVISQVLWFKIFIRSVHV
jgi:hypothetical protein